MWPTQGGSEGQNQEKENSQASLAGGGDSVTPESVPSSRLICISIWSKVHICHFAERDFEQGGHLSKATQPAKGGARICAYIAGHLYSPRLPHRQRWDGSWHAKEAWRLGSMGKIAVTAFFSRTPSFPSISSPKSWCSRSHLCDASCCLPLSPQLKRAVGRSCCLVSCKNRGLVSKRSWVLMGTLQDQAAI